MRLLVGLEIMEMVALQNACVRMVLPAIPSTARVSVAQGSEDSIVMTNASRGSLVQNAVGYVSARTKPTATPSTERVHVLQATLASFAKMNVGKVPTGWDVAECALVKTERDVIM